MSARFNSAMTTIGHFLIGVTAVAVGYCILFPETVRFPPLIKLLTTPTGEAATTDTETNQADTTVAKAVPGAVKPKTVQKERVPPEFEYFDLNTLYDEVVTEKKPPKPASTLDAAQHTTAGRIELGRQFFARMRTVNFVLPRVKLEIRDHARHHKINLLSAQATTVFPTKAPDWPRLTDWWRRVATKQPDYFENEFRPAVARFEELCKLPASPQRDDELWQRVRQCGRDWLQVPFDEASQRFNLAADLPETAPEVVLKNSQRICEILKPPQPTDRELFSTAPKQ